MNILEKHNLVKKLVSAAAMSFALLGGTYLVNNQTTQTVQAARQHIIAPHTVAQYNHYIRLANRKGTHYFGYHVEMSHWAIGADNYEMNGAPDHDEDAFFSVCDIVGTKTIKGKHFFIVDNHPGHFLVLAKDFYVPTSYQVKRGQTVQVWGQEETTNDNGDIVYHNNAISYLKFHGGKYFMVLDKRGSRNTFTDANGVVYRAVVESDGTANFIKQSDLAKMHKAAHTYRINGAKFNSRGRLINSIWHQ